MTATLRFAVLIPWLCLPFSARAQTNENWLPGTVVWQNSPVDLSFLNAADRPAGSYGRLRAHGESIVDGNGREVRLWGTNLTAYMLFNGTPVNICGQAKRLSALGFNLVRLHHHDSSWVTPNVFDMSSGTTRKLRAESLVILDQWVKCLNDEGIYIWLDLHVGRTFLPKDDLAGGSEVKDETLARAFAFVNPQIERRLHEFGRQYLDRKNTATGQSYVENAGIFAVQILNETDLGTHYGPTLYPGGGHPIHEGLFEELVEETSARLGLGKVREKDTWKAGAGKQVLADIELQFFDRALANLREFGWKSMVAVAPTWGAAGWNLLPALTGGDLIDVHSYGGENELFINPHLTSGLLTWVAGARIQGRPLSVSEWGLDGSFIRDRFTLPLHFAAVAALQGWNAVMHFAYQQTSVDPPDVRDRWASSVDPSLLVMMPAAALLFRRGDVHLARKTFALALDSNQIYSGTSSAGKSRALRTLVEQSRVVVALPASNSGKRPANKVVSVQDIDKDYLLPSQTEVSSDTGELKRDFAAGFHTVNTELSQAAAGRIGGRTITLGAVQFKLTTTSAAVAFSGLDGLPLAKSRKILFSSVAQAEPGAGDKLPFRAEPVRGQACVSVAKEASFRRLGTSGEHELVIPVVTRDARQCFDLEAMRGHHLLIESTRSN